MKNLLSLAIILLIIISCSTSKNSVSKKLDNSPYQRSGVVENRKIVDSILSLNSNTEIDADKPLILIYYPGKDECNSGGSSTRKSKRNWYNTMEKRIDKISPVNLLYIYKDSTGLYGRHDGYKEWHQDPDKLIEKLFFKQHPPCSGYVVISKDGQFVSRMAEFSKESLWNDLEYILD